MIRAIIFDCFGVLTTDGWLPFKNKYFGSDSRLHDAASDLNKQSGAGMISQSDFHTQIGEMAGIDPAQVQAEIDDSATNEELFQYIATQLKPKYKIGLLSNAGGNYLNQLFRPEQVALFDEVALSYEMRTIKPAEEAYTTILDRLSVEPAEAVFVDDQERHCTGARDVGMHAIMYEDFEQFKRDLDSLLS